MQSEQAKLAPETKQAETKQPETKAERYPEKSTASAPAAAAAPQATWSKPSTEEPEPRAQDIPEGTLPEGFEPVSIEAVGVWKGEVGIWVKPIGYTLSDSKPNPNIPTRVQAVILAKLLAPGPVIPFGQGDNARPIVAKRGDYIAIFYRPGLRDILKCGGITTWLAPNGERAIEGRADPMKMFTVAKRAGQRGAPLELLDDKDFRRETRGQPLPWERQARAEYSDANGFAGGYTPDDDDIPF
jgi:hypothetical protein